MPRAVLPDMKITWTTNNLTPEQIDSILGPGTFTAYAQKNLLGAIHARSHRAGAWEANQREWHAAYWSIETLLTRSNY